MHNQADAGGSMIDPNFDLSTIPLGHTRDDDGRLLSYRDESGFWYTYTHDDAGRVLRCINSDGHWYAYTRDDAGRVLTWITSTGCREDYIYDDDGEYTVTRTQEVPYAA
jgi:YD repeat-containing protein